MTERYSGLTSTIATARLQAEGPNALPRAARRSIVRIVLDVLREPMFALLVAGGAVYFALGDAQEAIILLIFATFSVSIAVAQDLRSERVLAALQTLASPHALVIRDGAQQRIPSRDVVRGDIIIVSEGDRVAADAAVRETTDLRLDESALTGESVPVAKSTAPDNAETLPPPGGDGLAYIYAGTLVVGGQGLAEVLATGPRSQIGAIGVSLADIQPVPSRTQREVHRLVRVWALVGLATSVAAVVLYGTLRGGWLDALLAGIALGMSMLPEEFPLVLTVFMVMGAWRISRVRVLTRQSSAIELLGAASVLCTDKTGTLTQNKMEISRLATRTAILTPTPGAAPLPAAFAEVVRCGALASPRATQDPMELAFHALWDPIAPEEDAPGTLERSYGLRPGLMAMSQAWRTADGGAHVACKGALEAVFQLCRMEDGPADDIRQRADAMAKLGLRVLGVAQTDLDAGAKLPDDHLDLKFDFVGLVGLSDPLREEVPAAIRECRAAGIRVVMVTGDYPTTAAAIAEHAGINTTHVLSGDEVARMDDSALALALRGTDVCARIAPLQKLRIVKALQTNGDVVAMTGDGVNDAPSLKAADIGVALGGRGTDVAREAASIVLLNDDFTSIVRTVRLGRRIYDNLRKAISYIMAVHIPIAGLALIPLIFGLPVLFFPIHIAFLEMIIDPICSLAFEAEHEEHDVMNRPPRPREQRLFTRGMIIWSVVQGFTVLAFVSGLYAMTLYRDMAAEDARALAFVALVVANGGLILVNRFFNRSVRAMLTGGNRVLALVLAAITIALALVLLWSTARTLFQFGPLHPNDLALAVGTGVAVFFVLNAAKALAPQAQAPGS